MKKWTFNSVTGGHFERLTLTDLSHNEYFPLLKYPLMWNEDIHTFLLSLIWMLYLNTENLTSPSILSAASLIWRSNKGQMVKITPKMNSVTSKTISMSDKSGFYANMWKLQFFQMAAGGNFGFEPLTGSAHFLERYPDWVFFIYPSYTSNQRRHLPLI